MDQTLCLHDLVGRMAQQGGLSNDRFVLFQHLGVAGAAGEDMRASGGKSGPQLVVIDEA